MKILGTICIINSIMLCLWSLILLAVNQYSDTKVYEFLFLIAFVNLPRVYVAYLFIRWFMKDNYETRIMMKNGFMISVVIRLVSNFLWIFLADMMFDQSFNAYVFEKYVFPEMKNHPEMANKVPESKYEEVLYKMDKKEKGETILNCLFAVGFQFYFYTVAKRFANMLSPS